MSSSTSLLAEGTRQKVEAWRASLRSSGIPHVVTSTRRSRAEQSALYARWQRGESDLPAAPPGASMHEIGRAVDVAFESEEDLADAIELAADAGLEWFGPDDPVHFEDPDEPEEPAAAMTLAEVQKERGFASFESSRLNVGLQAASKVAKSFLSVFGIGDRMCCKR